MATLLLPPGRTTEESPEVGEATLVIVLSPIPGRDGHLRTERRAIPAGQSIADSVPPATWQCIVWNGAVVPPDRQDMVRLQPGDELWCYPQWGEPVSLVSLLVYFAVGIAVSLAVTALTYVLFPPSKPHVEGPDPHTFSFEGIRTAIGPGNIVPIIYGTHRHGGQLISASVEQNMTILDTGANVTRVAATTTPPTLTMVIDFGEGPIQGFLLETLEINGQPAANYQNIDVQTRLGTAGDAPLTNFNEIRNTHADGRELPDNSSNTDQQIVYTTSLPVTGAILNIVFNEGLYHFNGQGEKEDNTVIISYRAKGHDFPTWGGWASFEVTAQRTAPVRFGIRREGLASAVHDFAVNFGAPRHNDETRSHWKPTLESVTEIQPGSLPNRNTARLALRAVATDQLQGQLPNVTVVLQGRTVRVSTFNPTETWSDNPAWCIMDALTNPRYGDGIPDSQIDLNAFQEWANYCDSTIDGERRHTFNYVLEREARVQALLLEMMGGSRTLMLKSEGLWVPRPTRNETPVAMFAWSSVSNVKVTYSRDAERVNVIEARFANEADAYQQDVLTWPTVDNWPFEVHKASLELRGVTKPSRVMRALQFELNRRHYETVQLEFDCSLEAATLQIHDLFRFSHPMPGWGVSGRIQPGSTQDTLYLDEDVTMQSGVTYHVYLRYINDVSEARVVFNPGSTTTRRLQFAVPFSFTPQPWDTLWAFGTASPDNAVRTFRCTKIQRRSDTTAHVEAVIHNPSIYDEAVASPTPGTPGIFNPLGPPPPLTSLVALELTRVQASGSSMRVVNLAWSVGPLGAGLAPYGGAKILRRSVLNSATAGHTTAGAIDLGTSSSTGDANVDFFPLVTVSGHVLETDDYTVVQGSTYIYRVIPISARAVPNVNGALDAMITVAGPTTPGYYPGTPRNLRLFGKPVTAREWEGKDCYIQWDTVADSPLFSTTFFVQGYVVQVWAPDMSYILRSEVTPQLLFKYTLAMNQEDQARNGFVGGRRDLRFRVYALTNTNVTSLDPADRTFNNPPPDMSNIRPTAQRLFGAGVISWDQYFEPPDFDHYEVHLDTMNPPVAIYEDMHSGFAWMQAGIAPSRKAVPQGLTAETTYYAFVLPYDTFGPGIRSQTVSFVPGNITTKELDKTPPDAPTNLTLTTGTDLSADGTIVPWVRASWTAPAASDVVRFEVHVLVGTSDVPTVYNPIVSQTTIQFSVPGRTRIRVKVLAYDALANASPFAPPTGYVEITSSGDTVPPAPPANVTVFGSDVKAVTLLWTPPADADYDGCEIWSSTENNRATATLQGKGTIHFTHTGLANPLSPRYYWIRATDTSGNLSTFVPASGTAGVVGVPGQVDTTWIESLTAAKILAGTIQALVSVGVANRIEIDGVNQWIGVRDPVTGNYRVLIGRQGPLSNQWGMQIFAADTSVMWNFTTGVTEAGITDAAVNARHLRAGSVRAAALIADEVVLTANAQIGNAIIEYANIKTVDAGSIIASTIGAQLFLGVGFNIRLDGVNKHMTFYDDNNALRVWLGRLGPNAIDWGMEVYSEFGNLMFSTRFGGSQTLGIAPAAVSTDRIGLNAVTAALLYADGIGTSIGLGAGEVEIARITFPEVHNLDQVLIQAKVVVAVGTAGSQTDVYLTLRADGPTGGVFDQTLIRVDPTTIGVNSGTVSYLYNVPADQFSKVWLISLYAAGAPHITYQNARIIGMRTQR